MTKLFRKKKNNKGFTLIELIVVIGILGILVALVAPNVIGFRDRATTARNNAAIETLEKAVEMHIAENGVTVVTDQDTINGTINLTDYLDEWPSSTDGTFQLDVDSSGDVDVTFVAN